VIITKNCSKSLSKSLVVYLFYYDSWKNRHYRLKDSARWMQYTRNEKLLINAFFVFQEVSIILAQPPTTVKLRNEDESLVSPVDSQNACELACFAKVCWWFISVCMFLSIIGICSFIRQGIATRRQRMDLFRLRVKLPSFSTSLIIPQRYNPVMPYPRT